jgi:adenylate cyclase
VRPLLRLDSLALGRLRIPVDQNASMQVPFRGPGGADGGSFRYVAAADVVEGRLAPGELKDKIVLMGATAPGLQDLRATPVGAAFPGVEVHANIVSGLLDQRLLAVPDYAPGYEVLTVLVAGLVLAFGLSLLSAPRAVLLGAGTAAVLIGLNTWLYTGHSLVLPLASALVMTALAFALNMSWGYFVESRARRGLVRLFGTYVPPQLVDEMLQRPGSYSMRAESKEMTVLFCDMRDFTRLSEQMAPAELQAFLNTVFSRLTNVISAHRGTVDKYMGDCVMAFWGAPIDTPDHAALAVRAALDMADAVRDINRIHRAGGRPEISVGIGINSGVMSVGDMGSTARRSYTVVGDAVNLASRLEGLSGHYGVESWPAEPRVT